jgi:hypothetical protein
LHGVLAGSAGGRNQRPFNALSEGEAAGLAEQRAAQRLGESEPIPGYQPRTRPPARHALLKNAN